MYDPRVFRAWRPDVPGVVEVLHAELSGFAYPVHAHDAWTVLLIDAGSVSYDLDGRARRATPNRVSLLPPHVPHDGRPDGAGFRKRVLYLDGTHLPVELSGRAVDDPAVDDARVAQLIGLAHAALDQRETLRAEEALATACEHLAAHLRGHVAEAPRVVPSHARALKALLDDPSAAPVTLAEAAQCLGVSAAHLARSFRAAYGVAPHAYLIANRVHAARRLLLDGMAPAEVAAEVGFYDQAHLTRHFRRHTAVTPARFAASGG